MSTTDATTKAGQQREPDAPAAPSAQPLPRFETSIVPRATISGRALVAVVAIMTFLASLTTGAVLLVRTAANEWQADVAREVTIQIRPAAGRDIEADIALVGGIAVLLLVLLATVLSVTFATRAAMATNRPVIEVLHLIGAKDNFIAAHFQRHFLHLGLKGGLLGGGIAIALFAFADLAGGWFIGTAAGDQFAAMFGTFSIGALGYLAVLAQIGLVAGVTAATSRRTVNRTIETIQ